MKTDPTKSRRMCIPETDPTMADVFDDDSRVLAWSTNVYPWRKSVECADCARAPALYGARLAHHLRDHGWIDIDMCPCVRYATTWREWRGDCHNPGCCCLKTKNAEIRTFKGNEVLCIDPLSVDGKDLASREWLMPDGGSARGVLFYSDSLVSYHVVRDGRVRLNGVMLRMEHAQLGSVAACHPRFVVDPYSFWYK